MAYIDWSPDLDLGIDLVDHDHKILVSLLNQAHDCMGDAEEGATLGSVLNALVEYAEFHFTREERVMEAAGFGAVDEHRELHRRLILQARDIRDRYGVDPGGMPSSDVMTFLRTWLMDHILKQDFRFREVVLAHPEALEVARGIEFDADGGDDDDAFGMESAETPSRDDSSGDAAVGRGAVDFSALSALVVDDNPNFQVILRTILKGLGCPDVRIAGGGEDGLDVLRDAVPALVMVDWRMDGMDGLDFVRAARGQGVTAPIVMVTGYNEPGFADRAREAGVNGVLEKPITARGLVETVAQALRDAASA